MPVSGASRSTTSEVGSSCQAQLAVPAAAPTLWMPISGAVVGSVQKSSGGDQPWTLNVTTFFGHDCNVIGSWKIAVDVHNGSGVWDVSANRDETVIPRANEFLIDRENSKQHLSVGWGVHFCMGSRLAW